MLVSFAKQRKWSVPHPYVTSSKITKYSSTQTTNTSPLIPTTHHYEFSLNDQCILQRVTFFNTFISLFILLRIYTVETEANYFNKALISRLVMGYKRLITLIMFCSQRTPALTVVKALF